VDSNLFRYRCLDFLSDVFSIMSVIFVLIASPLFLFYVVRLFYGLDTMSVEDSYIGETVNNFVTACVYGIYTVFVLYILSLLFLILASMIEYFKPKGK